MGLAGRPGLAELAGRLAAGIFAGYALSAVFAVWLSYVLPMPRADAVASGILISFTVYTAAVIFAFAARKVRYVWWGLLGALALFSVLAVLMRPEGTL